MSTCFMLSELIWLLVSSLSISTRVCLSLLATWHVLPGAAVILKQLSLFSRYHHSCKVCSHYWDCDRHYPDHSKITLTDNLHVGAVLQILVTIHHFMSFLYSSCAHFYGRIWHCTGRLLEALAVTMHKQKCHASILALFLSYRGPLIIGSIIAHNNRLCTVYVNNYSPLFQQKWLWLLIFRK